MSAAEAAPWFAGHTMYQQGSLRATDYADILRANGGSPYRKPVVLFLLPSFGVTDEWINELKTHEARPQAFEFVFARIAQDQQIWISIERHKPTVVVTTGDHWFNYISRTLCPGLPSQKVSDISGVIIPMRLPTGTHILIYPLPDLLATIASRKKRLSGGSPRGLSPSPSPPSSPPRSLTVVAAACIHQEQQQQQQQQLGDVPSTEADVTKLFDTLARLNFSTLATTPSTFHRYTHYHHHNSPVVASVARWEPSPYL